jgi:hypothetical protein
MFGFEIRWAEAILEAYAPSDGPGLAPTPGEVDYLGWFLSMRTRAPFLAALGLRLAVWIIALSPIWHTRRLRTFGSLALGERAALLDRLLNHGWFAVRELTLLMKIQASMSLLGTATVRARSGYDRARAGARALQLPVVDSQGSTVGQKRAS